MIIKTLNRYRLHDIWCTPRFKLRMRRAICLKGAIQNPNIYRWVYCKKITCLLVYFYSWLVRQHPVKWLCWAVLSYTRWSMFQTLIVWLFSAGAAGAGGQVLSLLLRLGSVEWGRGAGVALADHVDCDDSEGDPGVDLEPEYLESEGLLWERYELSVLLPVSVVLSPLNDVSNKIIIFSTIIWIKLKIKQKIFLISSFTLLFQLLRQSRVDPRWGDNSELWTLETRASLVDVDGLGESHLFICEWNFTGKISFVM